MSGQRPVNAQKKSFAPKIKIAWAVFGLTVGVLIIVALSVPVGPGSTPGSSTTLLQVILPWALALLLITGMLVFIIRWQLADRERERQAYLEMNRQSQKTARTAIRALTKLSTRQQRLIEYLVYQGAELAQLRNGQHVALLPDGNRQVLDVVEAEYFQVVEDRVAAGELPPPRSDTPPSLPTSPAPDQPSPPELPPKPRGEPKIKSYGKEL
jgi:hypothetical protein